MQSAAQIIEIIESCFRGQIILPWHLLRVVDPTAAVVPEWGQALQNAWPFWSYIIKINRTLYSFIFLNIYKINFLIV